MVRIYYVMMKMDALSISLHSAVFTHKNLGSVRFHEQNFVSSTLVYTLALKVSNMWAKV